ncbi:hypothetical protein DFH07DRAFT_785531 [Mycena maculata]|uniref:Uncharacterized protein n=1 Tax=Mycena maculata TaxID=230809 RepID=A0AAD7HAE3_9AGAR|nr:hypothetical protein DFH07DRAFT_785531 [Mycena maculata]
MQDSSLADYGDDEKALCRCNDSPRQRQRASAFFSPLDCMQPSANSYDLLHSDESGKWGKHLWFLLIDVLKDSGYKGRLTMNMRNVPRWKNLKHFPNVTTEEYTDGQAFLDILKIFLWPSERGMKMPKRYPQKAPNDIPLQKILAGNRFHQNPPKSDF